MDEVEERLKVFALLQGKQQEGSRPNTPCILYYCRVSTQQQVRDGHSIEAQKKKILDYVADKQLKDTVLPPFVDSALSGKNMKDRPEFQRMKSMMKKGDTIISCSLTRIGRNTKEIIVFSSELEENGINLIVLDNNIDTSTSYGRLFFTIMTGIAQFERELTSERNRAVIESRKADGYVVSKPPYGYDVDKETKKLIINEEEQNIISMMFGWIYEDPTIKVSEIQRKLQLLFDAGDIKMRNAKQVHASTITSIIKKNQLREKVAAAKAQ